MCKRLRRYIGIRLQCFKGRCCYVYQGLALEFASDNISVNAIAPGLVKTAMNFPLRNDSKTRKKTEAKIPIGCWADADEIANIALFLASDVSSYITGHILAADGSVRAQLAYSCWQAGWEICRPHGRDYECGQ